VAEVPVNRLWIAVGALLLTVLVSVPVLATGIMGSDAPSRIPVPAKVFSATFEDVGGTSVPARRVTMNGEVFVYGRYGSGQVTIPFERIAEVRISTAPDPLKRTATVTLVDGSPPVRVVVDDDTAWFGRATFGNYKIEMRDIRAIRDFKLVPKE
jgi:hypothetical protein